MSIKKEKKTKIESGQAIKLSELVEYSEGSIVSRTLIENDAGTVTLFAFDTDQSLSEHTAPFDALVQVIDGEGEFIVGGKSNQVGKEKIILMPANVPHSVRANKQFKMLLTMLRAKQA
jgi:quercetin dioxygenase-like cupin family protein